MTGKVLKALGVILVIVLFFVLNMQLYRNDTSPKSNGEIGLTHDALDSTDKPIHLGEINFEEGKKPAWVYVYEDKLYVSHFGRERIDVLDTKGKKLKDFRVKLTKAKGSPQGMYKNGDKLIVADYHNGALGIFADNGRLLDAYYETAEKRAIKPVSAVGYGDVMYITDVKINGWMAVFDDGEMVMEIKGDDENKRLEFPYGIAVTNDGRVIVTDPAGGKVKFFACSGWYAFDIPVSEIGMQNPQGVAIDSFDRIHIVDNGVGKVFVFDNLGKFMFSYGDGLHNPSTIAIDKKYRNIYIANTEQGNLSVWGY